MIGSIMGIDLHQLEGSLTRFERMCLDRPREAIELIEKGLVENVSRRDFWLSHDIFLGEQLQCTDLTWAERAEIFLYLTGPIDDDCVQWAQIQSDEFAEALVAAMAGHVYKEQE
jgi:hypothetical protein